MQIFSNFMSLQRMRFFLAFSFLLLFTQCQIKPQVSELKQLLDQQVAAWNKGDIDGFMEGYYNDSSMQFISKKGVRKGWRATLDSYKKNYPGKTAMGTLIFNTDALYFMDSAHDFGHITGTWKLIRVSDTPSGYFSLITRKTAQGHKIIIDHTW